MNDAAALDQKPALDAQAFRLPGRLTLAGAPEGADARWLAHALADPHMPCVLAVALDEEKALRLLAGVRFFAPKADTLFLPAWDCLPYDRSSPQADVLSARIATLGRLVERPPRLLVTTVNALVQRVPPRAFFENARFQAQKGGRLDLEALTAFLNANGYNRTDTVMEPGEYAVRGGLIDLFPPAEDQPLRLDLFGDEIETIRHFDPLTQRSTGNVKRFAIAPVNELRLTPDAIERFRVGYRSEFGIPGPNDRLYESVSAGRKHPGMEHWLPLFHDRLATVLDYLPTDAALILDEQFAEAQRARFDTIADHFTARLQLAETMGAGEGGVYRPLPPDRLYMTPEEWFALADERAVATWHRFAADDSHGGEVFDLGARRVRDFAEARIQGDAELYAAVAERIQLEQKHGRRVLVAAYSAGAAARLADLMQDRAGLASQAVETGVKLPPLATTVWELEHGFQADGLVVFSEQDLLGERISRRPRRRRRADQFLTEVSEIAEGDLVVHLDHGIGRYAGLETGGAAHDCLKLLYHDDNKLYVPVENIEVLSRYGSDHGTVQLDRLGSANWQSRKAKLKDRIREMAGELIQTAAARALHQADELHPPEGAWAEFCARFPHAETDDQIKAIDDVLDDLASGRPMDRLVCGDVGFGKTEVALRAAFLAVMEGYQVAVVVPTTLLARQHYKTFAERFQGLPVRVEQLSRLVTGKRATEVKKGLAEGQVDIIVGTHALLAKSIQFGRLGLLIVDEEQHFGVAHKERLKKMRADIHVLTMTATPIPRTLQLALSGVREMSLIATPPVDRLAVRTFVQPYDPLVIREAIQRELFRGGQVFYVCPRVRHLRQVEDQVRELLPELKIAVAHGGLPAKDLEDVMNGFYDRRFDMLIATNIIESGLDIPNANTLIVHRSDMFGLGQLYQIRGRIGRGKVRAYAYLTLPNDVTITKTAQRRLEVMQTLDHLGAGFTVASHDLDIRGAGNLLGEEQSGQIREVGIELYQQMLEEAVAEARESGDASDAGPREERWTPTINIGTSVLIPESYVPELNIRLNLYRRLSVLDTRQDIDAFAAELGDRFGPVPDEAKNLLDVIAIKALCRQAMIEKVDAGPKGAVLTFRHDRFPNPQGLVQFLQRQDGKAKLRPDHKLVVVRDWPKPQSRLNGVARLTETLAKLAAQAG
ncbi:MAG: transcription-repair coupling factor [Alphaproteobacteria bacterium]|nr:transcription-repair coupling factor [Alphaproteobacteria bacterium]